MDQTFLLYIMTAFVIIAGIALCVQAGMLVALYGKTKQMHDKIAPLVPKIDSLVDTAKTTVEQSKTQIAEITKHANEILVSAKSQLASMEEVVNDAAARAKMQLERVDLVLDDTISRAHETIATVHNGIMRPLKELNGIAVGIRAALNFLARNNRPSVAQATSDEEMFI